MRAVEDKFIKTKDFLLNDPGNRESLEYVSFVGRKENLVQEN